MCSVLAVVLTCLMSKPVFVIVLVIMSMVSKVGFAAVAAVL